MLVRSVEVALTGGAWRANDGNSYFWPNATSTSISFFGYSPYYDETSATADTQIPGVKLDLDKGITITDYVNNADRAKVVDLMYTTPQLDKKYTSSDVVLGKLPVVFNHALTQIAFTVKRFAQYNGVSIKVQNIKLVDIPSKGTFKSIVDENNIDDENWEISTDAADLLDYVIYDGGAAPQEVTTVKTDIGIAHLMLPQEAALLNFEVTYSISGTGVATETVTKQLTMGTLWDLNQRISYNLVIGLNEITFAPSITDWDVVDNINEYHVQASASTDEAINQAFNGLNKLQEDLLNETPSNEDHCSFTVSVPAGATADIAL